jgi:uroporphyrinogen III methyltransferase/synthase
VIPGVTSAIAAPAYAGIPVTHRGLASSFAVVTGHEDDEKEEASVDWSRIATAVDTIVVLMGGAALPGVARALIRGGKAAETPAVSVEWGTTTQQRSVAATLDRIAEAVRDARLGTPLLTVVGEVATLRDHIAWFENRPLFGKRVLVTRTRHQASALSDLLRREGAIPVELPTLELVPLATDEDLGAMAEHLRAGDYQWCLFTSTNAVDFVLDYLNRSGHDARAFAGCRLAALGSATAASLLQHGLRADLVASEFTSEGLLRAMEDFGASTPRVSTRGGASPLEPSRTTDPPPPEALEGPPLLDQLAGVRILIPRAEGGSPALTGGLRARGAEVDEVVLYESRAPADPDAEALALVRAGRIDVATFASSSSVRNLATLLGDDFARLRDATIACIGPVTAQTARELGLNVTIEPAEHTIPALVEALKAHYANAIP